MSVTVKTKIAASWAVILLVVLISGSLILLAEPLRSYAFVVEGANCGLTVTPSCEPVDTSNLNPGDTKASCLHVGNKGDQPLRYYFDIKKISSSAGFYPGLTGRPLDEVLEITVLRGGVELFHGLVSEFEELYMGVMQPGDLQQIDIVVHLSGPDVGNEYQGASVTVQFVFRANCNGMGNYTATPGYWSTHSKYGPAPYNEAWGIIGEDTVFYLSGESWYQVINTPRAGGNAYYILARQYIAVRLNHWAGATSTPEVDAAMEWSEEFFATYRTDDKLHRLVRSSAISYAELLDQYNNGVIGPGARP